MNQQEQDLVAHTSLVSIYLESVQLGCLSSIPSHYWEVGILVRNVMMVGCVSLASWLVPDMRLDACFKSLHSFLHAEHNTLSLEFSAEGTFLDTSQLDW